MGEKSSQPSTSATDCEDHRSYDGPASKSVAANDVGSSSEIATGFSLVAVVAAVIMTMFLASLDLTIVATAIPHITDQFHSIDQVGWYASTLFLTVAVGQSIWARAYKYFHIKWTYLASVLIFEFGSLICAVAQNSPTFIAGRAITGLGVAGSFSGSYIVISVTTPERYRAALIGSVGGAYAIASAVGPLIGGALTDRASWRWCFYINLPCGGAAALAVISFLHIPSDIKPPSMSTVSKILRMDVSGTIFILGSTLCLMLVVQWGGVQKPWSSSDVIGALVGFFVLFVVWIVNEWWLDAYSESALLVRRIMKNRLFWSGCAFAYFMAGNFNILLFYLPIYFQAVKGTTAVESGIRSLPLVLGISVIQVVAGGLIGELGWFNPFLIVGSILATIGAGMVYTLNVDTGSSVWIGYQALAGIGLGLCITVPIITTQTLLPKEDVPLATAIFIFWQSYGSAIMISIAQSVFSNVLVSSLQDSAKLNPSLDPAQVISTGPTEIQRTFASSPSLLSAVQNAYMSGLRRAFVVAIVAACIATLIGATQKWINLKSQRGLQESTAEEVSQVDETKTA